MIRYHTAFCKGRCICEAERKIKKCLALERDQAINEIEDGRDAHFPQQAGDRVSAQHDKTAIARSAKSLAELKGGNELIDGCKANADNRGIFSFEFRDDLLVKILAERGFGIQSLENLPG